MNRSSAFSHLEVIFSFHSECALQIPIDECISMSNLRGSRIFSGVGVKARRPENSMHNVFFSPQLI